MYNNYIFGERKFNNCDKCFLLFAIYITTNLHDNVCWWLTRLRRHISENVIENSTLNKNCVHIIIERTMCSNEKLHFVDN